MSTLPTSLVRFRGELEAAIRRDQEASRRRRRRRVVRVAVASVAAAAIAAGALAAVLPGGSGELVAPASAAQRAAAALAATPGSVVHVSMAVTEHNADGSDTTWHETSWQQTTPPYDRRQVVTGADGSVVETATVDGKEEVYDPHGNTVQVRPADGSAGTEPEGATPQPTTAEPYRDQIVDLLRSGKLTPSGRSTVDGRQTVSFTWDDGHSRYEYTVAAGTYDPVRWQITPTGSATVTTVTFDTYEALPAGDAPLDLTRVHPDAQVRREP